MPATVNDLAERLDMRGAISPSRYGAPVALLSRWPLRSVNLHAGAPIRNALLEAVVEPEDAAPLRIFVAHLSAGYSHWRGGESVRLREIAVILERMRPTAGEAQLLLGDFNSLPPGERLHGLAAAAACRAQRRASRQGRGYDGAADDAGRAAATRATTGAGAGGWRAHPTAGLARRSTHGGVCAARGHPPDTRGWLPRPLRRGASRSAPARRELLLQRPRRAH